MEHCRSSSIDASKARSSANNMTSNYRFLSIGIYPCGFYLHSFTMTFTYIMDNTGAADVRVQELCYEALGSIFYFVKLSENRIFHH